MRKSVLLLMSLIMVSMTGCDFIRTVAGRPTGRDIEEKRIAIIRAEEEALQSRLDSMKRAEEKMLEDSVAAFDGFRAAGVVVSGPDRLGGLSGMELDSRYYIIVGAFKDSGNARKLFDSASTKGYSPVLIGSRRGLIAVGLCPSNDILSIEDAYEKLKGEPFFPDGAWILMNE